MKRPLGSTQVRAALTAAIIVIGIVAVFAAEVDLGTVDRQFGLLVDAMDALLMGSIPGLLAGLWDFLNEVPLVVLVLACGAIYFTFRFDFINVRGIKHAVKVIVGTYDKDDDPGEVTHFQALSAALSATVGLGNIAGVAIAVAIGGPGAVFWMMTAAVFGMASKFAECTLGQMYRKVDDDGTVQGGPMVYLRDGLAEIGHPTLGKYLAVIFAVLCIGASLGAGNMFQANQSFQAMTELVPGFEGERAQGEITLTADEPESLDKPNHLIRVYLDTGEDLSEPSLRGTESADAHLFHPRATEHVDGVGLVRLTADDWTLLPDGRWGVTLPIEASNTGTAFNIDTDAELETSIEFGEYHEETRDVSWNIPHTIAVATSERPGDGEDHHGWLFGLLMAFLVGVVIIGGIKRIGKVAARIVPAMCLLYVLAALYILVTHYQMVPQAAMTIVAEAFDPQAGMGGLVGVLIVGIQRAVFSSEAGIGSAAIAHSAAKTKEPVREGFVALLEPGIDTIIVCFMTGSVIVITGVYADPATAGLDDIALTQAAFGTVIWWFPKILAIAVVLFAFSTMISWSYYGERCWSFLFDVKESMTYRVIFVFFVFLGSVTSLTHVLDFADAMLLSMAFPNIVGVVLLSPKIKSALQSYWQRLNAGEFDD